MQPMTVNPHDGPRPSTGRTHSSSLSKVQSRGTPGSPNSPRLSKQSKPSTARQSPNTGAKLRPNAPQPRDARIDRESIGDFADFIKSTGPANPYGGPPPRAVTTATGHRGSNSLTKNGSESRGSASSLPKRAESSAGRNPARSRLQARDAVVPRGDSISDLIDFVRSGPQLDTNDHRIPRTVAPFRTTMDSDQMNGAVGGRAVDASLPDPRYSQASASVDSSVTSQSALLSNQSRKNNLASERRYNDFEEEEDIMPQRKQRRVRDMYQIDFSDEEEEYEALTSSKPVRPPVKEESLADFLRNVPPPPDSSPAPIYQDNPTSTSKKIKKKPSTGIMSRFGRSGSIPQVPTKPRQNSQVGSLSSRSGPPPNPSRSPVTVQYTSKYAPVAATNEPSRGNNYVSQVDSARNKVVQKSYQPREAVYSNTQTSDLASFLRDSAPPSEQSQPRPFVTSTMQKEESSTFQRMFGRKKIH
jgi:hypothetical protein